ncbi:MAG: DUF6883 domain-containing protein [bacterium]
MKIPNADRALIDIKKLQDYCLSPYHPRGKYKAHLFREVLGLTSKDAAELKRILLNIVRTNEAVTTLEDQYGKRYIIDSTITTSIGQARVRSSWIILSNENFPRLTSCYILKRESKINE